MTQQRTARRRALWAAGILLAATAAVVLTWRLLLPRPRPLESGWSAAVHVMAGDGVAGMRDGPAPRARFSDPFGVAAAADGTIYVSDAGDAQRVRRIAMDGTVTTVAGGGGHGHVDGPAASARFNTPSGLAIGPDGTLYVADTGNNAIRRIAPDGMISTIAGDGTPGYQDGAGAAARFNGPIGLAVDASGRVVVADTYNDRIRAVLPDGTVTTIAGSGRAGAVDGPLHAAQFHTPCGVAIDRAGTVYVADTGNGAVRMISPSGFVAAVGPLPAEGLLRPIGIAVNADGSLYVTDDRGRVVEIVPGISARIVAGSRPGFSDGEGSDARFRGLTGLAFAAPGRLVAADPRNALVRLVAAKARLELRPPVSPRVNPRFDPDGFRLDALLWPLAPMEGPFEITGTLGESRGGEGTERLHAGVDVHAEDGAGVVAVRNGVVASPIATSDFGTLNESVRIGTVAYVHIRVGRERSGDVLDPSRFVASYDETGRMVGMRVKRGARFTSGEPIGSINRFQHVHLSVGWPGEEYNPLLFRLVQFGDTVPPTIARRGIRLFSEDGQPLVRRQKGRLLVEGRVRIVVDAWDQVDGNEARRRLGLYALGYQVLNADGSPAAGFDVPRETIRFDRLAADNEAARLVYAYGSGIPYYGRRTTRFLYVVTNTLRNGLAAPGLWDTTMLPAGDYTLRILAADVMGNEAIAGRDLPLTVGTPVPR